MTHDRDDFVSRIKSVLPARWFGDDTPTLDTLLGGLATAWEWLDGNLDYVRRQTRLLTASDRWLDMIARDFFGRWLSRRPGQPDEEFRWRIARELVRERATRAALRSALVDLTGQEPRIFEPANCGDTGAYGSRLDGGSAATGLAFGRAGGWGSLSLPMQTFVVVSRPAGKGIAQIAGWGTGAGGYGIGASALVDPAMVQGQVTDTDVYTTIAGVMPTAGIAWTQIRN